MRRTTMASFLRASLVLAAVVLPVFGQWGLTQKFSDAKCTTLTGTSYSKLVSCMTTNDGNFGQKCVGGKIDTNAYSDKACGTFLAIAAAGKDDCSSEKKEKKSCVDTLPDGYTKLDIEYYSGTVCSGTSTAMSMGVKLGVCVPKSSGYEITTMTATTGTTKKYLTADCSEEAKSTEDTKCGVCKKSDDKNSLKYLCSSFPVAAAASAASGPAVSKVAVVALAGVAAFLA